MEVLSLVARSLRIPGSIESERYASIFRPGTPEFGEAFETILMHVLLYQLE